MMGTEVENEGWRSNGKALGAGQYLVSCSATLMFACLSSSKLLTLLLGLGRKMIVVGVEGH